MATSDLTTLSMAALIPKLQSRELSARALVDQCIERIGVREPAVRAWVAFDPEAARAAADDLDRGPIRGLLHGVPVGIKDIIDVAGLPTECGSPVRKGRIAERDAACVQRLRAAGALIMGKTVTTEFSYFSPGKTANPRHLRHTPGGSSSGSAAAVADRMVPVALGAQTAGSLIRPAAYCGVVGFKPSHGAVALDGVQELAPSLDTLGWFTREVEDAEVLRAVMTNAVYQPLADLPALPRIAVCETHEWRHAGDSARRTLASAADSLRRAGVDVAPLALPFEFEGLLDLHVRIMSYEAARALHELPKLHAAQISPQLAGLIDAGRRVDNAAYEDARRRVVLANERLQAMFGAFDAIMAPSAPGEAPLGLSATGDPVFSRVWTLLGAPAIALPVTTGAGGLPLGVQLIGCRDADRRLLAVAKRAARWMAQIQT